MYFRLLTILAVLCCSGTIAAAEGELDIFREMLPAVCGNFENSGSSDSFSIDGDAEVKLAGLLKKLTDLGVSGAANIKADEYVGVVRTEVGDQLNSVRDCRERVWRDLSPLLVAQQDVSPSFNNSGDNNANLNNSNNNTVVLGD